MNKEQLHYYIQEAIEDLPEFDAKIVRLHFVYGYKVSEIADKLKCSTKTIKRHLHTSLKPLWEDMKNGK